jgi:phosphoserine aminotransferase
MESIIFSLRGNINVTGYDGEFKERWRQLVNYYYKIGYDNNLYCRLETSKSKSFSFPKKGGIIDCISSFPFYDIDNADIFVTSTNKLLGSLVGLSIIGIKKDFIKNLIPSSNVSYLNLNRYLNYNSINQTPTTTPTYIFEHLNKILDNFNIKKLKNKIKKNCQLIYNTINNEKAFIGEIICPVLTIKKEYINKQLAKKWQLYGINKDSDYYQIFTYSCPDKYYKQFCKEI